VYCPALLLDLPGVLQEFTAEAAIFCKIRAFRGGFLDPIGEEEKVLQVFCFREEGDLSVEEI
jgi:hypothetical protein